MSERLQKIIASSGLLSRRAAEEAIKQGVVTVNGAIAHLGQQADPAQDRIVVAGTVIKPQSLVAYALYKPKGVVSSRSKQGNERIITDFAPTDPPVYPVGRLDKDSEGLIILTNDGALTQKATHPSFEHAKSYLVDTRWQKGVVKREGNWIKEKLLKGVKLGDGLAKADAITLIKEEERGLVFSITVHEGRNHLIRRMCATMGLDVMRLTRTRIGAITLGKLKPGDYRALSHSELTSLR